MTAPNLVNTSQVFMRSNIQVPITGVTDILETPAASNMVTRADVVTVCNTTDTESSVDLYLTRSSSTYALAKTIAVPAYSAMVVLDKDYPIYLEEGDKLQISGGSGLQAICSYTIISDTSITLPGRPTINTPLTASTFINSYAIAASQTSYSFNTASIPAGLVAITISSELTGDNTVTSVTIGGVSATQAAAFYQNQASGTSSSIWYAIIGSSTTSVSVSFAASVLRCGIGVYTIENYISATPVYNNAVQGPNATTPSITTPSISSGSAIIAVRTSGDIYSHTWSGVTEDYDNQIGGGLSGQTGASLNTSTTQTHTIESVGDTAGSQGTTMAVAVWK